MSINLRVVFDTMTIALDKFGDIFVHPIESNII